MEDEISEADERLGRLGYVKRVTNSFGDEIFKKQAKNNIGKKIIFYNNEKKIEILNSHSLEISELRAIYRKCKEKRMDLKIR